MLDTDVLAEIQKRRDRSERDILPFWKGKVEHPDFPNLSVKWSKYIPDEVRPTSKQLAGLLLDNFQESFFGGAAGSGKVVLTDGVVLTPFGFKKIQDLKLGDAVNNPDGSVAKVIQLHPWTRHKIWRVHFHDGTFTDVAKGHLWLSWRSGKRKKNQGVGTFGESAAEVVETATLKEWSDEANRQQETGIRPNWPLIPVCQPQRFNVSMKWPCSLDPYQLGYWLGDGHSCGSTIGFTCADHKHFRKEFAELDWTNNDLSYRLTGQTRLTWTKELTRLSLLYKKAYEKFIPREYKYGSIETRYAILQGLLDTDGTVGTDGHVSFTSTSRQLADDVKFVIESLGGTAVVSIKNEPFYRDKDGRKILCRRAYTLYIKHRDDRSLFRMVRKQQRCEPDGTVYRRVVKVEILNRTKLGRCITVSHPNGLYLTNDFIVTHNSSMILMQALQWADHPKYNGILFRRTAVSTKRSGGLLDTLIKWLSPHQVGFDSSVNRFFFPEGGSLTIGYFDSVWDYENYQGNEYQYIAFDELDQWPEEWYLKLFDRLRKTRDNPIPLRMRGASNPGGYGHAWIKKRFQIQLDPKTNLYRGFNPIRPVVPAYPWDNPHIDLESYVKSLIHVDPLRREQMLMGNWMIADEGRIKSSWFNNKRYATRNGNIHLDKECKTRGYPIQSVRFFKTIDPAASSREGPADQKVVRNKEPSYTVISTWFIIGRVLGLYHVERFREEIPEVCRRIAENYKSHLAQGIKAFQIGCENSGPGLGVYQTCCDMRLPMVPLRPIGDKVQRNADFANRASQGFVFLPDMADVQSGNWLTEYEEELFRWSGHPSETDDQVDTSSYAAILTSTEYSQTGMPYDEGALPYVQESGFGTTFRR